MLKPWLAGEWPCRYSNVLFFPSQAHLSSGECFSPLPSQGNQSSFRRIYILTSGHWGETTAQCLSIRPSELQTAKYWSDEELDHSPDLKKICSSHSLLIQVTGFPQRSLHTPQPRGNVHVKIIPHLLKAAAANIWPLQNHHLLFQYWSDAHQDTDKTQTSVTPAPNIALDRELSKRAHFYTVFCSVWFLYYKGYLPTLLRSQPCYDTGDLTLCSTTFSQCKLSLGLPSPQISLHGYYFL